MEKFVSLKKNADFGRVYRQGRSYGNRLLVMYVFDSGRNQEGRIGISVSKKVGNSVVRHRLKRQIRECFRTRSHEWKDGCDIVVIAKKEAKDTEYQKIESALRHLGKKLSVYIPSGDEGSHEEDIY